jgi:hypothetical protein
MGVRRPLRSAVASRKPLRSIARLEDKGNGAGILYLVVRLLLLLAPALLMACVERRLLVRTDPPGAEIRVNGEALGRAPAVWRFDHYGKVLVEAELPGHARMQKTVELRSPWYQKPVIDFFADVLVPARIRDEHEVDLRLAPLPPLTPEAIDREVAELTRTADKWKREAETSR